MTARNQSVQSARTRKEYTIDLSEDLPVLCEARANRILSQMDIYRDTSSPFSEQQHRTHILQATELQPHNYYDATARV